MEYIKKYLECKGGFTYYDKLNSLEKEIYDILLSAFINYQLKVTFYNVSDEKVQEIIHYVLYDHPYIFYISHEFLMNCYKDHVEFVFNLVYNKTTIKKLNKKIDKEIKKLIKLIKAKSKNEYDEILMVNSIICSTIKVYNPAVFDFEDGHLVGALLNKKARCEGVTKLTTVLLRILGYQASMIHGYAWYDRPSNTRHAWNLLYFENKYYHMDFSYNLSYSSSSFYCKSHLFLSDKEIFINHKYVKNIGYPTCKDESVNYFRILNQVVKNDDYSNIKTYNYGKYIRVEFKLTTPLSERKLEEMLPSIIINKLKIDPWKDVVYKYVESLNDVYLLIKL